MTVRAMLAVAALLALAGCVSDADLRRQDEVQCRGYGFTPGTTDFATCLQRESLARRYPPPDWGPPLWPGYAGPFWWR